MADAQKTGMTPLQLRFKKYRSMKQWRDLTDAQIMEKAVASLERDAAIAAAPVPEQPAPSVLVPAAADIDLDIRRKFTDPKEQVLAQALLNRYVADYNIEHVSEQNTVRDVIYLEVVQQRLQDRLNQDDNDKLKVVPFDLLDAIHSNAEAITKLKNTLGLNKSKDKRNAYDELEHLKRRYAKWLEENQASRHLKCPHCVKPILLRMRTDAWEAQQHPWFRDNVIYNKHLFANLDKTVTIDRQFIAQVLEVSPDYIDWVVDKTRKPIATITDSADLPTPSAVVETPLQTEGIQNGSQQENRSQS